MRGLLILGFALLFVFPCQGQNDLLILKKNKRNLQTFYPGSEMMFTANSRFYDAYVTAIDRDTVFLVQYDIRQVYTSLRIYMTDTVASYHFGISYHDITSFGRNTSKFNWNGAGGSLFGGGILLTTAGLVTWLVAKPNTRYYARPGLVIGAAALAGVGYLIMKSGNKGMKLGKKYSLHYIEMK